MVRAVRAGCWIDALGETGLRAAGSDRCEQEAGGPRSGVQASWEGEKERIGLHELGGVGGGEVGGTSEREVLEVVEIGDGRTVRRGCWS